MRLTNGYSNFKYRNLILLSATLTTQHIPTSLSYCFSSSSIRSLNTDRRNQQQSFQTSFFQSSNIGTGTTLTRNSYLRSATKKNQYSLSDSRHNMSSTSSSSSKKRAKKTKSSSSSSSETTQKIQHVPSKYLPDWFLEERTRILTTSTELVATEEKGESSSVIYWMQRDVRVSDNWALLLAAYLASDQKKKLKVVYILPGPSDQPQKLTERHVSFLLGGLKCVQKELESLGIEFHVLPDLDKEEGEKEKDNSASVGDMLAKFASKNSASVVVSDFSPLRTYRRWIEQEATPSLNELKIPLFQVDAHNIVPVWKASDKREVGARTLRPKINKLLSKFLTDFPTLEDIYGDEEKDEKKIKSDINWDKCHMFMDPDKSVETLKWAQPGTSNGMKQFEFFCKHGLKLFDKLRNDPTEINICSDLSPWINHGHISFQRVAHKVNKISGVSDGKASFIEEGIVRRELSDNFVFYSMQNYDSLQAAAQWAQDSLELHKSDPREHVYEKRQLEFGGTHDDLWNSAQAQLVFDGKMHGFLRMYWAKKILEWTSSPAEALSIAQYFNDKYAIDGNDPNGFVGVGWSIMGIHDMGWKERPIFGKIRYMNYNGCKRKFKVADFVQMYSRKLHQLKKLESETNSSSSNDCRTGEQKAIKVRNSVKRKRSS